MAICPICKNRKPMKCEEITHHYQESGLDFVYLKGIKRFTCECGESIISIPAITKLHQMIGRILTQKDSLLSGQEIRFIRKNMKMQAKELAAILGVDKSTISRWENSKQDIDKSYDRLLRLVYAANEGVPAKSVFDNFHLIEPKHKEVAPLELTASLWASGLAQHAPSGC